MQNQSCQLPVFKMTFQCTNFYLYLIKHAFLYLFIDSLTGGFIIVDTLIISMTSAYGGKLI